MVIGIVFSPARLRRLSENKEEKENIQYYYDLSKEHRVNLLFYCLRDIRADGVEGYYYDHEQEKLEFVSTNVPKVNLMRTLARYEDRIRLLRELENEGKAKFLNLIPTRDKLKVYRHLAQCKRIGDRIPETDILSLGVLHRYLQKYGKVIIKPNGGAFGQKVMQISRNERNFFVEYMISRRYYKMVVAPNKLPRFYKKIFKNPSSFVVQQWVDLCRFEGGKMDIRVSVQKNKEGVWGITGNAVRVAPLGGIVTNVAQGGRVISYKDVKDSLPGCVDESLSDLSFEIAEQLEKLHPSVTDLGLDIAVNSEGKLWLIEANFFDERYSFRESKETDLWFASYRNPFEYAYSLLMQGKSINESTKNSAP